MPLVLSIIRSLSSNLLPEQYRTDDDVAHADLSTMRTAHDNDLRLENGKRSLIAAQQQEEEEEKACVFNLLFHSNY